MRMPLDGLAACVPVSSMPRPNGIVVFCSQEGHEQRCILLLLWHSRACLRSRAQRGIWFRVRDSGERDWVHTRKRGSRVRGGRSATNLWSEISNRPGFQPKGSQRLALRGLDELLGLRHCARDKSAEVVVSFQIARWESEFDPRGNASCECCGHADGIK